VGKECSELLLNHAVGEEEEGRCFVLLLLLVSEGASALHIVGVTSIDLEFIEPSSNELDGLGGSGHESLDSLGVLLLQPAGSSLEVRLDHSHEVLLGHDHFVKLEVLDHVVDHLDVTGVLGLIGIEGSLLVDDNVVVLGDVLGLDLPHGVAVDFNVGEGIGEHLVTGKGVFKNFHDCCLFIFSWMDICFAARILLSGS